jgi:hypothetical protein
LLCPWLKHSSMPSTVKQHHYFSSFLRHPCPSTNVRYYIQHITLQYVIHLSFSFWTGDQTYNKQLNKWYKETCSLTTIQTWYHTLSGSDKLPNIMQCSFTVTPRSSAKTLL